MCRKFREKIKHLGVALTDRKAQDDAVLLLELGLFASICIAILIVGIYSTAWTLGGYCEPVIHRLRLIFVSIDEHWKASLLVLIPLFYRPIRIFLLRVERVFGIQAGKAEGEEPTTNPRAAKDTGQG